MTTPNNKRKQNNRISISRKICQFASTILYNLNVQNIFLGRIHKGPSKGVCVPGLNCYSCPAATGACPLGALQQTFSQVKNKANAYVCGCILAISVLFGRFVCGWLCPFGLLQELLYKIPTRKFHPSLRKVAWPKYVVLAIFVIGIPVTVMIAKGIGYPAFCKYICPQGTISGVILSASNESVRSMIGPTFILKAIILVAIIVASVFVFRPFCRTICPLGAIYGIFNAIAFVRIQAYPHKCTNCGKCKTACPVELNPVTECNHADCLRCGKCVEQCPEDAIKFKILNL